MDRTIIDGFMNRFQKWMVLLPIVAFVLFIVLSIKYVSGGSSIVSWVTWGWGLLASLIMLYAFWCLSSDARKRSLSSAKYLEWWLYISVISILADIVGAFVSVEDMGSHLESALPSGLFVSLLVLVILVGLAFVVFVLIVLFSIPSKLKQDGFLSLRKLFVEYIIIVGILMGAGIIPEDMEFPITAFVEAYYAYKFFRCRNELKESETC